MPQEAVSVDKKFGNDLKVRTTVSYFKSLPPVFR